MASEGARLSFRVCVVKVVLEVGRHRYLICLPIALLHFPVLPAGFFPSLERLLTQTHQLTQTCILLLEGLFHLRELLLVSKPLLRELGVDHFVGLPHLNCLVILDHDFVEAVPQSSDLAHHWMVVVAHLICDRTHFLGPLLQAVKLLPLCGCLGLQIVELASPDRQIFFYIALPFGVILGCLLGNCLLLELLLEHVVLLFQRVEYFRIFRLDLFATLHLGRLHP